MHLPRIRISVRGMMVAVAVVGLSLGIADAVSMSLRSSHYRRRASGYETMEQRCRAIVAMDPATRAREAEAAFDDPFLDHPEWTLQMIPFLEKLKDKYNYAADHPRIEVPSDPPHP
jgi:hypothetical protein